MQCMSKYPALENKHFGANLIKMVLNKKYIVFYLLYNREHGRRHFEYLIEHLIF